MPASRELSLFSQRGNTGPADVTAKPVQHIRHELLFQPTNGVAKHVLDILSRQRNLKVSVEQEYKASIRFIL